MQNGFDDTLCSPQFSGNLLTWSPCGCGLDSKRSSGVAAEGPEAVQVAQDGRGGPAIRHRAVDEDARRHRAADACLYCARFYLFVFGYVFIDFIKILILILILFHFLFHFILFYLFLFVLSSSMSATACSAVGLALHLESAEECLKNERDHNPRTASTHPRYVPCLVNSTSVSSKVGPFSRQLSCKLEQPKTHFQCHHTFYNVRACLTIVQNGCCHIIPLNNTSTSR